MMEKLTSDFVKVSYRGFRGLLNDSIFFDVFAECFVPLKYKEIYIGRQVLTVINLYGNYIYIYFYIT